MKISDLMWFLSEVPMEHRKKFLKRGEFSIDFEKLAVYHVTKSENIEDIKQAGLKAQNSQQSYDRPAAVYFFVDKSDIDPANLSILGLAENYKIVRVLIPAEKVVENMVWDGLYNATFESSYSAVQYLGDVPAEWIVSYDYPI